MKLSYNWLRHYIDIEESPEDLSRLLTDTGLEVEGLEKFEPVPGGLEGLVIGTVKECSQHPNADKLSLCKVDVGEKDLLSIVCGAPNVAAGQRVVVAPVGTTLHPTGGEPFKIKKAKIRGEVSEGMICAEDEIGLGSDHTGIIELDTNLPDGTDATEHFNIEDDWTIEIGLTPNRGDGASHIGAARDIKAVTGRQLNWPDDSGFKVDNTSLTIPVEVENTEACPRYSAVTISGVDIKESPEWLKKNLEAIGLSPISNVVDITNYIAHGLGQPLHAFDADKIEGGKVIVKTLKDKTPFLGLDEVERKLSSKDLMICDTKSGMCIGGVFGGINSGITDKTRNVFLESAYFSPEWIRRTVQLHELKTDASFRFERGTDPSRTVYCLKIAAMMIKDLAGGEITSEIVDVYPDPVKDYEVPVKFSHIDRLIGKSIEKETVFSILESLDIRIDKKTDGGFVAVVPPYRLDVQREADVIEEIIRIYGFNNVEIPDQFSSNYLAEFPDVEDKKVRKKIGNFLASNGFYEIVTNSLTRPEYAAMIGELNEDDNINILNKLSEDYAVMRQSNIFTGLEVLAYNLSHRKEDLKLFEFGKNYFLKGDEYTESMRLSLYMTGNLEAESWVRNASNLAFHDLSGMVTGIIGQVGGPDMEVEEINESVFRYAVQMRHKKEVIARLGMLDNRLAKKLQVKSEIFYAELDWSLLLRYANDNIAFRPVSKFPEVRRDLSLVIDKSVSFEQIRQIARKTENNLIKEINVFDVFEGEQIGKNKRAYALSFILQSEEKTLTENIINKTMTRLMQNFETQLGAFIRT